MIKRARDAEGVRITFTLDTGAAVSVVGDFNEWDPAAHPLKPRTNGKRSVSVLMHPGRPVTFRYLAEGGHFFDDPDADRYEDNGYGGTHGVLVVPKAVTKATATSAATAVKTAPARPVPATPTRKPVAKKAAPAGKPLAKKAATTKAKGKPKR